MRFFLRSVFLISLATIHCRAVENEFNISGRIIDATSREPLPARLYIRSAEGKWFFAKSTATEGSALEMRKQPNPRSVEMHTTLSAHPFTVRLPAGRYEFLAERGKEYAPVSEWIEILDDSPRITLKMQRWINMAERGWFSGDTHSHRPLTEMTNVILAEDVNVGFPMTQWVTATDASPAKVNKATGPIPRGELSTIDRNHLLYPLNTEYEIFTTAGKSHTLGAILILGHKTPYDFGIPPVAPVAAKARTEGALIDLEKHSWPWSIAMVPILNVDLFELSNNHIWRTQFGFPNWTLPAAGKYMKLETDDKGFTEWGWLDFGFQTYYALLNSGFRLRPTAGTAAGVHPVPFGFSRVYVHQPNGFTYENWMKALNEGRSFVTTGPMLFVTINDAEPGSILKGTFKEARVKATIEGIVPLDFAEIIINGITVKRISTTNAEDKNGVYKNTIDETLPLKGTSWVVVRAFEKNNGRRNRFAHSSPIYFHDPARPLHPRREEIDYLINRVQEEIDRNRSLLAPEALKEYETALQTYQSIANRIEKSP